MPGGEDRTGPRARITGRDRSVAEVGPVDHTLGIGMAVLPRLALAVPATGPDPSPAALAWLASATGRRRRVQHFRTRACLFGTEAIGQVTGLPGRHLDAWLMPDEVCRRLFVRGARRADLSLVEGTLDELTPIVECSQFDRPGELRPIAEALDLPIVALVPCRPGGDFHLPHLPEGVDAILLDELEEPGAFEQIKGLIALTLKKPVLGAVEALPEVREALRAAPRDRPLPEDLIARLGASFNRFADLAAIRALAFSRPFPATEIEPCGPRLGPRFRVAYAQDEAFGAYFPDTLETLEALGAELVEFSPLGDERLPESVDLVMIGCGHPEPLADALAGNYSLIAALRSHVCRGQRIYAEGSGTAYLGRSLIVGGRTVPGAGILPFDAELLEDFPPPAPVSRTLVRDSWLGPKGTVVRGYKAERWRLRPGADPLDCPNCFGPLTAQGDVAFHHHAIGGLLHLHLSALPEVVRAFAGPHRPSLTRPSARPG
jgi:cobyrinic acid a,c-diamide synthase